MQRRILQNLMIVSLCGIVLTTAILYVIQTLMAHNTADEVSIAKLEDVSKQIWQNKLEIAEMTEEIKADYIDRAHAFALMIELNPGILDDLDKLDEVVEALNVDEVHVIDENGILMWGSIPLYYGMDFSTTDQTRPFLAILDDPTLEIVQNPMPNGYMGLMRQYAGVSLRGRKGIAEIGMTPERLETALRNNQIGNILRGISVGNTGYLFSVSADTGKITSHPNPKLVDTILSDPLRDSGFIIVDGQKVYYRTQTINGQILAAAVPVGELYADRSAYTVIFLSFMFVVFGAFCVAVNTYIKKNVVSGIDNTIRTLDAISAGNLDVAADVRLNTEFVKLSDGINHMLNSIKAKMSEIASLAGTLSKLGAAVSISDAGIIVKDKDGAVTDWNLGSERILGYTFEEIIGKTTKYYTPEDEHDSIDDMEKQLEKGRRIELVDVVRKHRDGRLIDCSASYTPVFDGDGEYTGSVTVFHDISDKKQMERALRDAVSAAEEASSVKSNFLANMSHEIRTPMNAVIGMADLLLAEEITPRQRRYANDVKASGTSLLGIINNILDLSKIESGKFEVIPVDYDFISLLENIDSIFTYTSQSKHIEYISEKAENLPACLFGDDIRLRQVLTNLLGNAVKFTSAGHVKLKTWASDHAVFFEISDTGMGIKQEDIDKLFNPFQQVDFKANRNKTGTGLGLSISKSIVEVMDGALTVKSEYGKGSTFLMRIPRIDGDPEKIQAVSEAYAFISAPEADILVVDDFDVNLNVADGLLRLSDIKCDTAISGRKAIEMVELKKYDIIFMDHMMPGMDGEETTQRIREMGYDKKNYPIIALTANAVEGVKEKLIDCGMNDFLSKPIDKILLNEMLIKWLPPEKVHTTHNDEILHKVESATTDEEIAKLRETGAIDVDAGLALMGGSTKTYKDTMRIITKRIPEMIYKMMGFLEKDDLYSFAIDIHGVKNSLATAGTHEMSKQALDMETQAKAGDADFCNAMFPGFSDRLLDLCEKLNKIFFPAADTRLSAGDTQYLRDRLNAIRDCLDKFDDEAALGILESLADFDFGSQVNNLLKALCAQVEMFDYDNAGISLDSLDQYFAGGEGNGKDV